jgi:molybdopterin-guanine dinucleotide biosynthesis protein A
VIRDLVILAGGGSTRMGLDKAALELGGAALLDRELAAARAAGLEPLVAGRTAPAGADWRGLADERPGQGPLGGLVTALRHLRRPCLAVAVDLPLVGADGLTWLAGCASAPGAVADCAGDPLPVFAAWWPELLPEMELRLERGERSLHRLIAAAGLALAPVPGWLLPRLLPCNTPEEFARVARLG